MGCSEGNPVMSRAGEGGGGAQMMVCIHFTVLTSMNAKQFVYYKSMVRGARRYVKEECLVRILQCSL